MRAAGLVRVWRLALVALKAGVVGGTGGGGIVGVQGLAGRWGRMLARLWRRAPLLWLVLGWLLLRWGMVWWAGVWWLGLALGLVGMLGLLGQDGLGRLGGLGALWGRRAAMLVGIWLALMVVTIWQVEKRQQAQRLMESLAAQQGVAVWLVEVDMLPTRSGEVEDLEVLGRLVGVDGVRMPVLVQLDEPVGVGERVAVRGRLVPVMGARNWGGFERGVWLRSQGVNYVVYGEVLQRELVVGGGVARAVAGARAWAVGRLRAGLPPGQGQELMPALLFGLSAELDFADRESFRQIGALHLFAVSGLHVALVAWLLALLFRWLDPPQRWLVVLSLLFVFVALAGMRASALRAWVMVAVFVGGMLQGRGYAGLNALAVAALVEFFGDVDAVLQAGFLFSYAVVLSLFLVASPLQAWLTGAMGLRRDVLLPMSLEGWERRWWRLLRTGTVGTVVVSVVAWLASLPIQLGMFGLWNPFAPLVNVLLLPGAVAALFAGLLGLLLSLAWAPLGFGLRRLSQWICGLLMVFSQRGSEVLPHWQLDLDVPQEFRLTVLDLDQGQGIWMEWPEGSLLVDCGRQGQVDFEWQPFFRYRGVRQLDTVVMSHADARHVGAMEELLELMEPRLLLTPPDHGRSGAWQRGLEWAADAGMQRRVLVAGDGFDVGEHGRVDVLWPPAGEVFRRADDMCLVLLVRWRGTRVLLLGDTGTMVQAQLREHLLLRAGVDVVVQGHHSVSDGADAQFWALLRRGAREGRPLWRVVSRVEPFAEPALQPRWLRGAPMRTLWQSQRGAVALDVDERGLGVRCKRGGEGRGVRE